MRVDREDAHGGDGVSVQRLADSDESLRQRAESARAVQNRALFPFISLSIDA